MSILTVRRNGFKLSSTVKGVSSRPTNLGLSLKLLLLSSTGVISFAAAGSMFGPGLHLIGLAAALLPLQIAAVIYVVNYLDEDKSTVSGDPAVMLDHKNPNSLET